jgi:transposase-like protein
MIQRGGQVVLHMLPNVQQKTIKPIIEATVTKGSMLYTDEYDIYDRLPIWGYQHQSVVTGHTPWRRLAAGREQDGHWRAEK